MKKPKVKFAGEATLAPPTDAGSAIDWKLAEMLKEEKRAPPMFGEESVAVRFGRSPERVEALLLLAEKGKANDPAEHWVGMPECSSEDLTVWGSVKVNFASEVDYKSFVELVGQPVPLVWPNSIWYPKAEVGRTSGKSYESTDGT